ncbi:MAG TPA: MlaD family protein [Pseudomonadales bacterium]|nr:MlaD family protein [Pseudomonadales bacterium]
MTSKISYVRLGIFVVVLTTALIWGALWLSAGGAPGDFDFYTTYMNESVSGLSPDAALTYRGVNVGKVTDISIDPRNPDRVRLLLQVKHGVPIKQDTEAILAMQGLTGLATIDLLGGSPESPPLTMTEGEPYPVIPSRPSLLVRLDSVISDLLGNLIEMSQKVNSMLDDDSRGNIASTLAHIETITGTLAGQSNRLSTIVNDAETTMKNARQASTALPDLMRDVSSSTQTLANMAEQLRAAGETINATSKTLQRTAATSGNDVQRFTASTLPDITAMTRDLRDASENLRRISESIERDPSVLLYGRAEQKPGPGE